MIGVSFEPGLFARELLKMPLGTFRTTLLKALTKRMMPLAVALDCFTTERLTGTIRCQVHDAEVNTEGIRCVLRGRWKHFKGHSQIEDAFAVDQISLPFDRTHTSLLVLTEQERHQYAPSKRQEGDGITALQGHDAGIIDDSALRPKMMLNALIALIGFAGFTDTTDSQLSWELIGCAQLTIHQLLQLKLVSRVSSRGYLSHIVRGLVKGVHCLKQSLMLFSCGCKLQEHRLFHRTSVQIMRETVNGQGRRNAIPPRPQGAGLPCDLRCERKESCLMQWSTDARRMKAAIWCQALRGDTSVSCPIGQVVGIRRRKGQLLAFIRGWGRWYPVEDVLILAGPR